MTFEAAIQDYFKAKADIRLTIEGNRYDDDELVDLLFILDLMERKETSFRNTPQSIASIEAMTLLANQEMIKMFNKV